MVASKCNVPLSALCCPFFFLYSSVISMQHARPYVNDFTLFQVRTRTQGEKREEKRRGEEHFAFLSLPPTNHLYTSPLAGSKEGREREMRTKKKNWGREMTKKNSPTIRGKYRRRSSPCCALLLFIFSKGITKRFEMQ